MAVIVKKIFNKPDETKKVGRMKVEAITIGSLNFARHIQSVESTALG